MEPKGGTPKSPTCRKAGNRQKKDFYGFRYVTTTNADGTYQIDEYYNRDYYSKGCLKERLVGKIL